jgi:hypothetical protein
MSCCLVCDGPRAYLPSLLYSYTHNIGCFYTTLTIILRCHSHAPKRINSSNFFFWNTINFVYERDELEEYGAGGWSLRTFTARFRMTIHWLFNLQRERFGETALVRKWSTRQLETRAKIARRCEYFRRALGSAGKSYHMKRSWPFIEPWMWFVQF